MAQGSNSAGSSCNTVCWLVGALLGLLVIAVLMNMAEWGFLISLAVGAIATLGAAWVLNSYFCKGSNDTPSETQKFEAAPVVNVVEEAAAEETAAEEAAPAHEPAAAPEPASEPEAAEEPAAETSSADGKPMLYDAAPDQSDDLKRIKGVGPGLEKTLNELGIYTFAQIAAWTAEDVAWVDGNLKFKGRIERDDWMRQAKTFGSEA